MDAKQEEYIREHFDEMSCECLRKNVNEKFGTQYKTTAFHYHTNRLGLSKHNQHKYTKEQDAFLKDNSEKMTRDELVKTFNKKFGLSIKLNAIEQRCHLKGWKAGTDGKFQNGSVPWEKTKGGREEYIKTLQGGNSSSFKKGHIPHNVADIGAIRTWGHEIKIKTKDGWKNSLRHLWESKRGEIPDGYIIINVNGDKHTDNIDDLRIVSQKLMYELMSNRWVNKGAEIVDTGIMWCKLRSLIEQTEVSDDDENY